MFNIDSAGVNFALQKETGGKGVEGAKRELYDTGNAITAQTIKDNSSPVSYRV